MSENVLYYELRHAIRAPGLNQRYHPGHRLTKEQWLATGIGFIEDDFSRFSEWFSERTDPVIEIDLCVAIISQALGLPSSCSPNALQETVRTLRRKEGEAQDVAKAYGLRIAGDIMQDLAKDATYPTEEEIREHVRRMWERAKDK